ncbi:hypothetical protein L6164_004214 [Bauhinia variegata]|uniref:Uncharacterized protein n=1 Tax=Bauhinia variegata TaxID=167791 RepID=A0ACB9Q2T5_BAUVA|nr:hypothetical protein L6164_004214 [Bauhinia variegata]
MATVTDESSQRKVKAPTTRSMPVNKGAWTPEEDRKLAEVIAVHGARRWKSIADKAGLNRCGKSCRLRWLNYLRPNIKRGNISDEEEDLILRLHKLLGNRWSLIAARLPGRTDNEIKNYWNSHLSKKTKQQERKSGNSARKISKSLEKKEAEETPQEQSREKESARVVEDPKFRCNGNDFFDFLEEEGPLNLEWVSKFLELD